MTSLPESLQQHRVATEDLSSVSDGKVVYAPLRSLWFIFMAGAALIGGALTFSWGGVAVFLLATGAVLLLGHSLGSHRKLIHDSFACPKWLEYFLVYMGVQVGLAGPIGLLRAHDLRDFAQRLPDCHPYLRHGSGFWRDAWWQIHCELKLARPPKIQIEPRIAQDRFYQFLERTWILQQIPPALALYALGGWGFVFFGTCARVTAGVFGHWLIGYFAHNQGGMHFAVEQAAVQGRNIRLASILTMGECWHNNHHAYPGSARLGLFPGEWDPGWWMLLVFRRLGLAWDFRLPQDLPARAELVAQDSLGRSILAPARYDLAAPRFADPGLAGFWRVLWHKEDADRPALEWPASVLSARAMRLLVGARPHLAVDPALDLLVLHREGRSFIGLPALCLAMAERGFAARIIAAVLLPVAVGIEKVRRDFSIRFQAET
jgi:fatty-acid desaturase